MSLTVADVIERERAAFFNFFGGAESRDGMRRQIELGIRHGLQPSRPLQEWLTWYRALERIRAGVPVIEAVMDR